MEFIEGPAVKLRHSQHFAAIEQAFRAEGINYIEDASIFEGSSPPLLIDFGTVDPNPPAEDTLGLWS